MGMGKRDLLSLWDLGAVEMRDLFRRASELKALRLRQPHERPMPLQGKTLGMIFEKASTRTRVSFEVGMYELGGHAVYLTTQGTEIGRGEPLGSSALDGAAGVRYAWIGDGNNMAHSWIEAAAILGLDLTLACPEGYD